MNLTKPISFNEQVNLSLSPREKILSIGNLTCSSKAFDVEIPALYIGLETVPLVDGGGTRWVAKFKNPIIPDVQSDDYAPLMEMQSFRITMTNQDSAQKLMLNLNCEYLSKREIRVNGEDDKTCQDEGGTVKKRRHPKQQRYCLYKQATKKQFVDTLLHEYGIRTKIKTKLQANEKPSESNQPQVEGENI
jgi:hypothetical protein